MSKETTYRWLCASVLTTEQYEAAEKKYASRKGRLSPFGNFSVQVGQHPLSGFEDLLGAAIDEGLLNRIAERAARSLEDYLINGATVEVPNRQGMATSAERISGLYNGRMAELLRPRPFASDEISMEEYRRRYMQHIDATFSVAGDSAAALALAFSSLSRAAAPQAIVVDSMPRMSVSMDGGATFNEYFQEIKQREEPVDTNPKTMYSKTPPPWAADWRNKRNTKGKHRNQLAKGKRK